MPNPLYVLVTGATGNQGGAVCRCLVKKGHKIRALTRRGESNMTEELRRWGAEIAVGNFDDLKSLERAMKGVDAVFAMATPLEGGAETEIRHGKNIIDSAKSLGINHVVYSSVASANRNTGIPHFESKHKIEEHIRDVGIPYTIVAPVYFMENVFGRGVMSELQKGRLVLPLPANRNLQQIEVSNIAEFVVWVLERKESYLGKRFEIASDELSGDRAAEILSQFLGRTIEYVELPIDQARTMMGDELAKMFDWFNRVGYEVNIPSLKREFPSIHWHSFEEWAKSQDWSAFKQAA